MIGRHVFGRISNYDFYCRFIVRYTIGIETVRRRSSKSCHHSNSLQITSTTRATTAVRELQNDNKPIADIQRAQYIANNCAPTTTKDNITDRDVPEDPFLPSYHAPKSETEDKSNNTTLDESDSNATTVTTTPTIVPYIYDVLPKLRSANNGIYNSV